jgi:hypothetical protein
MASMTGRGVDEGTIIAQAFFCVRLYSCSKYGTTRRSFQVTAILDRRISGVTARILPFLFLGVVRDVIDAIIGPGYFS